MADRIVIAGAGSVGCFVGGRLAAAGRDVALLARPRIAAEIADHGLTLSDLSGDTAVVAPDAVEVSCDPSVLRDAAIVLVTVKSRDTVAMSALIAEHAPTDAIIVSLQNGVANADRLRSAVGGRRVLAGMVPFNVLALGDGRFHRGTSGAILVENGCEKVVDTLAVPGLKVAAHPDMPAVQWGKLLINLNNALNALSGLPLRAQLRDRRWRVLLAAQQEEGLRALRRANIRPWSMGGVPIGLFPTLLRLPTFLFTRLAKATVRIDPAARSSMWEDLEHRRPTEIDDLQGEIVRLAELQGLTAPTCARVLSAIRCAEQNAAGSPSSKPGALASERDSGPPGRA